jgi:hypothetical protein
MTRAWPFMTQDERMQPKPSPDPVEQQEEPESAYCECLIGPDEELTQGELATARCDGCGKPFV